MAHPIPSSHLAGWCPHRTRRDLRGLRARRRLVEVDNNVWVIGDDNECFVIDAAHEPVTILSVVGDRHVLGILCTHGHNDHINAVPELVSHTGAAAYLHPADRVLWDQTQEAAPDAGWQTVRPLPWAMSSCGCSTRRVTHRVRAVPRAGS